MKSIKSVGLIVVKGGFKFLSYGKGVEFVVGFVTVVPSLAILTYVAPVRI